MYMNFQNLNLRKKYFLKYKPKKELDGYKNYIIEENKNFLVINKPSGILFNQELSHLKI